VCVAIDPNHLLRNLPRPDPTDEQRHAIAAAAKELDRLRNNRLNPPEWTRTAVLEFPGTADGPWRRYIDRSVEFIPRESGDDAESHSRGMNSTLRNAQKRCQERMALLVDIKRLPSIGVFARWGVGCARRAAAWRAVVRASPRFARNSQLLLG